MKTLYIILSFIFFSALTLKTWAQNPTFSLMMDGTVIDAGGGNFFLDLTISMNGSSSFGLGSSNLQFTFDTDISNPVLESENFTATGNYAPLTLTEPATGKASINVVLLTVDNGLIIVDEGSGWTELVTVRFDISNTSGITTLDWSYTGSTTETVVFKDNEIDQLFVDTPSNDLGGITSMPLPIEYVYYKTEWNNSRETSAKVSWETATESNNDHFAIERSGNSYDWESIGKVDGAGFSNGNINYEFIDENVHEIAGDNLYYRIKQVNFDGSHHYTQVMVLTRTAEVVSIEVFPTVFRNHLSVNIQSPEDMANEFEITISDLNGNSVKNFQMFNNSSLNISNLNDLQSGVYFVKIIGANYQFLQKVVKQ